jgi:Zn-dependent oligopeptidase
MTGFDDQTLMFILTGDEYPDPTVAQEARNASYLRQVFLNEVYLRSDLSDALSAPVPPDETGSRLQQRILENFQIANLPRDLKDEITRLGMNLSELERQYRLNQREGAASPNLYLMSKITEKRQQIVSLLGFSSFAEYQVNQSGIRSTLHDLQNSIGRISAPYTRKSYEEAQTLLAGKQVRNPDATMVYDYEIASLRRDISPPKTRGENDYIFLFSPADLIIRNYHDVISHLFGITITPVPRFQSGIPEIKCYRISDPESESTLACFYLLVRSSEEHQPASGKTYYLRSGRNQGECWIPAVSAVVLTVPARNAGSTIFLSPDDLSILSHEYGHMLRHSLSKSGYATLSSGSRELTGYIEIPSHFMERLARNASFLSRVYVPVQERGIPVSNGTENLSSPENTGGTIDPVLYDLLLSDLDIALHSGNETNDFMRLFNDQYEYYSGFRGTTGGADLLLSPAFFISGNAGVYWHYVIDGLYADELFSRFHSEGILNSSAGISFRREVFEPSGSEDPQALMENFLGYHPGLLPSS